MSNQHSTTAPDNAFCLSCGYPLRDLPAPRCPECGRPFIPTDPLTMSLGRPLRPWQRWLLRPTGWPTITLALLATGGLIYLSRWPRLWPEPISVLLDEFHWPRPYTMPLTALDVVFYAAVFLWAAFVGWMLIWQLARWLLVPSAGRRANVWRINTRRRRGTIAAAAILSILFMIFGWQQRVGRRWMARAIAPVPRSYPPFYNPRYDPWRQSPVKLSRAQVLTVLDRFIVDLPTADGRLTALRLLIEDAGRAALPSVIRAATTEPDENVLGWEIRLIGVCRDPDAAPLLISRLHDSRPLIRAAAADAIGILRHPSYSISTTNVDRSGDALALDTSPPTLLVSIISPYYDREHDLADDPPLKIEPSVRATLEIMMVSGSSQDEREAAARTLVDWPPDRYQFRFAEWGVWINSGGHMALVRSILDEIPPFVHRTGNPVSSFDPYFLYPNIVTKPVIHLTSNVPLAADVEVHIREGRPWFACPKPDDFGIGVGAERMGKAPGKIVVIGPPAAGSRLEAKPFERPAIPSLGNCREGYPWLVPHHRLYPAGWYNDWSMLPSGLRWQSLIVLPSRASWNVVADLTPNPLFRWWNRLREVPSCWVTSRGETERFLYYDGPTRAATPINVGMVASAQGTRLTFTPVDPSRTRDLREAKNLFHAFVPASRPDLPNHEGLYIEVRSGQVRARAMGIPGEGSFPLELDPSLTGESAVSAKIRDMLLRYGLTGPEADGLIASWAPQFFRAEGRRFILRMSPEEYARQCPMQLRPTPTEVVRLGLVLTEFDPQPTSVPAMP